MIRISNKKILLIAGWIVYASFMLSKRFGVVYHPLIQGYFSDFMAVPLMLGVILLLMRVYTGDRDFKINGSKVLVAFVYISVVFELILPMYRDNFHSDAWDVVAYGLGSGTFLLIQHDKSLNQL
jgi:hypothetical protein